jgi:hypothetical protein
MGLGSVAIAVATFALPTVRTFKLLERRNAGNVIDEQDFVRELKSWAVYGSLAVTFAAADALVEGVLPLVGVGELGAALALSAAPSVANYAYDNVLMPAISRNEGQLDAALTRVKSTARSVGVRVAGEAWFGGDPNADAGIEELEPEDPAEEDKSR